MCHLTLSGHSAGHFAPFDFVEFQCHFHIVGNNISMVTYLFVVTSDKNPTQTGQNTEVHLSTDSENVLRGLTTKQLGPELREYHQDCGLLLALLLLLEEARY